MKASSHPKSGKRILRKRDILFIVKKGRNNSLRLKVNSIDKLSRLNFKQGSALFASLYKQLTPRLRKRGYAPETTRPLDPFGILTGKQPLPFKLVARGLLWEMGPNECVICVPPGGGCACIECDKIVVSE